MTTENLIPQHAFLNCQWQECPDHNPDQDPAYTPPMQWPTNASGLRSPDRHAFVTKQEAPPQSTRTWIDAATEPRNDVVTLCAWCQKEARLNVLNLPRRPEDLVVILIRGTKVEVSRTGKALKVSHGICEPCRVKHFELGPQGGKR